MKVQARKLPVKVIIVTGAFVLSLIPASYATGTISWASGVGIYSASQSVAGDAYRSRNAFNTQITAVVTATESSSSLLKTAAQTYAENFSDAEADYNTALMSASQTYRETMNDNGSTAAKQYLSDYDTAQSKFMMRLDNARNTFVSEMMGTSDPGRDAFLSSIDSARADFVNRQSDTRTYIQNL